MKNDFADYADALQYLALGAGLGFAAINPGGAQPKKHKMRKKKFSLKNR